MSAPPTKPDDENNERLYINGRGPFGTRSARGALRSRLGGRDTLDFQTALLQRILHDEDIMSSQPAGAECAAKVEQDMAYARHITTATRGRGRGVYPPPSTGFKRHVISTPIADHTPPTFSNPRAPISNQPTTQATHASAPPTFHANKRLVEYLATRNRGTAVPTSACSCRFCFGYEAYLAGFNGAAGDDARYEQEMRRVNKMAERVVVAAMEKRAKGIPLERDNGKSEKVDVEMLIRGVIACRLSREG